MAGRRSARPDLRLAVPALSAWTGAFVATSGQVPGVLLLGIGTLLCAALGVAWSRDRWAVVACVLALLAGLGMGQLRWVGLHVDAVDQLARDGAAARVTLVVTGDPATHAGRTQGSSRRGADLVGVPSRLVTLTARGRLVRARLPGLVLGDTSRMPPELVDDFRTAGLTHLVAVSGANVAIVVGFVLLVARWLGARGRWLPVLGVLATAGFVVLARPQPSVLRAAVMGGVALLALATGRRRTSLAALGAAVLMLVLIDPWLARSYGFVLSTLATAALVVLAPGWTVALRSRGLPAGVAAAVAVPLAAQAVCGPVIAMIAGRVSLVAVLANLLAAPAVAPATVLGVLATVTSVASGRLASLIADAAALPAWWIVTVAQRSAAAPMASIGWSSSLASALVLAVLTVAVSAAVRRLSRRPRLALGCAVLLVVGLAVPVFSPGWPPRGWLLVVCDVGQGDGMVLSAGAAGVVVVDAGPDPRLMDRCLRRLGVHRVVMVVLSHFHADHVEGLPGVLRGRSVGEIVVGPYGEPAAERARVLGWAGSARVPVRVVTVGERVSVGPLVWRVLWPHRVIEGEGSAPNNASIVMLVHSAGVRLLVCGDIEPAAQRALLESWTPFPVDVLKVAHHGSAYQSPELLAALRPRIAVISVGANNDYGHPAPRTLRALRRLGAVLRRTDRDGTMAVVGPAARLRVVAGPR